MPIHFYCPLGHRLRAPERKAGREIRCPVCNHRVIVPRPAHEADPPGPPPLPQRDSAIGGEESRGRESEPAGRESLTGDGNPFRTDAGATRSSGSAQAGEEPVPAAPGRSPRREWFRRRPRWMPPDAYEPDAGKVQTVRWLALLLAVVIGFSTIPAWNHLNLQTAPNWARIVLLLAALETFYILWMVATPDWASVWVVMIVFAFAAALYGMATAITLGTPPSRPLPLAIGDLRHAAPRWCGAVLMFHVLATCLCGHTSARWRRSYELQMAGRRNS
ncbi:MAG TPA: hypothetical protein VMY37_22110 [Thermoguttaceae bacterium]|nr:hypothetical protein [Thermoguttaceae bacterium]